MILINSGVIDDGLPSRFRDAESNVPTQFVLHGFDHMSGAMEMVIPTTSRNVSALDEDLALYETKAQAYRSKCVEEARSRAGPGVDKPKVIIPDPIVFWLIQVS